MPLLLRIHRLLLLSLWGCLACAPSGILAQGAPPGGAEWNGERALELLALGRQARQGLVDQGTLESYQALTEGHIYFYVDPEEGEPSLIRVDQVAVELYWEAPDLVRQRIVGERSETRLPVRDFRYYLDRLTLVQYGFGDWIEVGQGMDVSDVPHPLAPRRPGPDGSPLEPYDVQLVDSLSLRFPGETEPLRILELQVRPRDPTRPGIVGSIFLSADDGALVRMRFTFTPASYVDPRTDRIQVEVDYGLWEGRYWLPNRQEIEVRREVPELDFGVGTVIRAVLRTAEYELNVPIPTFLRLAPAVTQLPESERGDYPFREGLFDALERDGMGGVATRADPRALRAEAARLLGNRPPTGLSPLRFHLPALSSLVRADRARGVTVGLGASVRPGGAVRLRGWAGGSMATRRPALALEADGVVAGTWTLRAQGELNGRGELGARPAGPALFSTAGALLLGEDGLDPFRRSHLGVGAGRIGSDGTRLLLEAGVEWHRSEEAVWTASPWAGDEPLPAVLPVHDGTWGRVGVGVDRRVEGLGWGGWGGPGGARLSMGLRAEGLAGSPGTAEPGAGREGPGALDAPGRGGLYLEAEATLLRRPPHGREELRLTGAGGVRALGTLAQHQRLLGGRGSVPGFPFRHRGGSAWVLAGLEGSRDLGTPWVRIRGGVDAGWAGGDPVNPLRLPEVDGTILLPAEGARTHPLQGGMLGVRAGVGLVYDILRLEVARGVAGSGGEWQFLVGIDPIWWDRL